MLSYLQFKFKGGNELGLAMEDADQFMVEFQRVLRGAPDCCVLSVEIIQQQAIDEDSRVECVMTLKDGLQFPCWIEEMMVSRVTDFPEIVGCHLKLHLDAVLEMKEQGEELDQRLNAAIAKLLTVNDMSIKLDLLLQCLHRKRGYLAAVEALVEGHGLQNEGNDNVQENF